MSGDRAHQVRSDLSRRHVRGTCSRHRAATPTQTEADADASAWGALVRVARAAPRAIVEEVVRLQFIYLLGRGLRVGERGVVGRCGKALVKAIWRSLAL
eukprot:scaffold18060_cov112-Isochrysis_galbana.AAC.2